MKPRIDLHTAGKLPSHPIEGKRLAAMALPVGWVIPITDGRPEHAFAVGDELVDMRRALAARALPLLSQGSDAVARYRAALEERWGGALWAHEFDPGHWGWAPHPLFGDPPRTDPSPFAVPPESWIVCTCAIGAGCHLEWLAPFLVRAGWDVHLYGVHLG